VRQPTPSSGQPSPGPQLARHAPELQPFGTLWLPSIALSAEARGESAQLLIHILADSMIAWALYKKSHWPVAGPTSHQLHLLFDQHAEEQVGLIDPLAQP
jgi:starvation-inducible DNA-binding protein